MRLGDLEFHVVTDGGFRLDGGAMFGVIPKPMWEKKAPADARNRIALSMNCLLVRTAGKTVLLESGAGDKWDAKRAEIYGFDRASRLLDKLAEHAIRPQDVHIVVNTHLHFDHCGWNTRLAGDKVVPTFPEAQYIVQKGELEHARKPTERDRASYLAENFEPLAAAGQWRLLEDDAEIVPGMRVFRVPGHTADMQCVRLDGGRKTAVFLADLVPTTAHIPYPWIMGFDLYPLTTLENKKKWIPEAIRQGWLVLFAHDAVVRAAYLREKDGQVVAEPVKVD